MRTRAKGRGFRRGYTIYMIVLAVLFIAVLAALWIFLAGFQQRTEKAAAEEAARIALIKEQEAQAEAERRAPQLAFESWLAQADTEYWTEQWLAQHSDGLDTREQVNAVMVERFAPDSLTAWKAEDYSGETPRYVLKNGDTAVSRVSLSGSGASWSVSGVELLITGDKSASVTVASGSTVFCNGVQLGEQYAGETASVFTYEPLKASLINPVALTTYTVEGLLAEPELTAEAPAGYFLTETEGGDYILGLDTETGKPYQDRAVAFIRSYLYYYMSGYNGTSGNLHAALGHLAPGSEAYTNLSETLNGVIWNTAYSNIDTTNTTAGGVVVWADNCYSVDVSYDANCTLNGQAIDYDEDTVRVYFTSAEDEFVITNFEIL